MRRIAVLLGVVAVLLLLDVPAVLAAGGGAPPPFIPKVVGPTVNGTILIDTHLGGSASVFLNKGQGQATFQFLNTFLVSAGCLDDVSSTAIGNPNQRFLYQPTLGYLATMTDWVPPFVLESLFLPLGIVTLPAAQVVPAITQINSARCVTSPAGGGTAGWLLMDVTIQFLVPAKP